MNGKPMCKSEANTYMYHLDSYLRLMCVCTVQVGGQYLHVSPGQLLEADVCMYSASWRPIPTCITWTAT